MTLLNKHIVVTRAASQSASLTAKLQEARALVFNLPLIDTVPSPRAHCPAALQEFDWLVATSVNAVRHFKTCLGTAQNSYTDLFHCRVAAIGDATAQALREEGLKVHTVPKPQVSYALIQALLDCEPRPKGKRVLLPQGNLAKATIAEALEAQGMSVTAIVCYDTILRHPNPMEAQAFVDFAPDGITFFSPSAVKAFIRSDLSHKAAARGIHPVYASIGPVTTEALQEAALEPIIEAHQQREDDIVETLNAYFST